MPSGLMEASSDAIPYTVHSFSSFSAQYHPTNILVDNPTNTKSRWTALQSESSHWIVLQLEKPAVLKSITFGKFHNTHPCNMKEFKIYVGMSPENLTEVVHSSLKNDSIQESFAIRHRNNLGFSFPTRFVKIEPLSVHGQSYNTSIWHVAMTGIVNDTAVEVVKKEYDQFRETRVLQHILKHLRQSRLLTPYNTILSRSGVQLEHPFVSKLYESIVLKGEWDAAERLLTDISDAGLFDDYLRSAQPYASWTQIHDTDANGDVPNARGGHAMCMDHQRGYIYLFGGWDGEKSLDDFWRYDIKEKRWSILSPSTSLDLNAPGARSCHKMVYDSRTNSIYVLGRLSDSDKLTQTSTLTRNAQADETPTLSSKSMSSEFYRYHCDKNKWESLDTLNGPRLVFDHQMVMDSEAQLLYVFGGRLLEKDEYSGLYSYNVRMKKWILLQAGDDGAIPSRLGHSMILEPNERKLFIFAGESREKFLSDMHVFDIASNTSTEVFSDFTSFGGPQPCFTQRAVIDPTLHEIYVFHGLVRNQQAGSESSAASSEESNWLYRYHPRPGKWDRILPESRRDEGRNQKSPSLSSADASPSPRYAHQVVYDPGSRTVYLHGGAVSLSQSMERKESSDGVSADVREDSPTKSRLVDFWKMTLLRPSSSEITRKAAYRIRQQRFKEMCQTHPAIQSLSYLQTAVSEVVDHSDATETQVFRSLLTHLLMMNPSPTSPTISLSQVNSEAPSSNPRAVTPEYTFIDVDPVQAPSQDLSPSRASSTLERLQAIEDPLEREFNPTELPLSEETFLQRTRTFESILEFIADNAKQPAGSLLDLVDIDVELL